MQNSREAEKSLNEFMTLLHGIRQTKHEEKATVDCCRGGIMGLNCELDWLGKIFCMFAQAVIVYN